MSHKFFDLTFTPSVKTVQERLGSRRNYARFEGGESDFDGLSADESVFIEQRDGFYMATIGENAQPYIQFRGGAKGFLKRLDKHTLGFADFRGNMQYISVGNIAENHKVALFLMDYPNQTRLKILATAETKDLKDAPELVERLAVKDYPAKIERVILFHVQAFDWNCQQHIPRRFTTDEIETINEPLYAHIKKLDAENKSLREQLATCEKKLNKTHQIKPSQPSTHNKNERDRN
jgi:uncharacterized protein